MAVVTLLGAATFDTNSGTHTVVATPAVNDLIVIIRANTGNTSSATPTDTASGSYAKITTALKATSVDLMEVYIRTTLITSAVSTTFSDAAGVTTGGGIAVLKVTGMTKLGAAAAIRSGVEANFGAGGTPAPFFPQTPSLNNPIIGAIFNATSPATMTPRTGYTELLDVGYATPTTGLEVMSINSGETNNTITWGSTSASAFASLIMELDASPTLTQASFRLDEDGTETASIAIASQDTNITRAVTSNSNLQLRVRLQNAGLAAGLATDDYLLQYSKNGGTYYDVGNGQSITGAINGNNGVFGAPGGQEAIGQALVMASNLTLTSASLYLTKAGTPTDNLVLTIYTGAIVSGTLVATSDNVAASGVGTAVYVNFNFSTPPALISGTTYYLRLDRSGVRDAINQVRWHSIGSGTNGYNINTGVAQSAQADRMYILLPAPVIAFNSASLTDAATTTNRIGAGTGSFVAGKISETGTVIDHAITASNYTEYLYSLTIVSSAVAHNDTLDFRVSRNAVVLNTYTVTPRVTVSQLITPHNLTLLGVGS